MSEYLDIIARTATVVMAFLSVFNIILRAFGYPIRGNYDIVCILALVIGSCALAYCGKNDGHVAVGIVVELFPKRAQAIVDAMATILALIFFAVIIWKFWGYGIRMFQQRATMPVLELPIYPLVYLTTFAFLGLWLVLLARLKDKITRGMKK